MFTVYAYDYETCEELVLTRGDARHCYYYARQTARLYASRAMAFEILVGNDATAEILTRFNDEMPFDLDGEPHRGWYEHRERS